MQGAFSFFHPSRKESILWARWSDIYKLTMTHHREGLTSVGVKYLGNITLPAAGISEDTSTRGWKIDPKKWASAREVTLWGKLLNFEDFEGNRITKSIILRYTPTSQASVFSFIFFFLFLLLLLWHPGEFLYNKHAFMSKETGGGNPAEKEGEMCTGTRKRRTGSGILPRKRKK